MILWATHLRSLAAVHFELEPGFYQLGRSTPDDPPDKLAVPFDHKLSRRTARIEVKPTRIVVQRAGSKAPLFVEGTEREQFDLIPGQRFGVAETVFELAHELGQTVTAEELEEARSGQSDQVLETMLKIQPLFQADVSVEELGKQINRVLPSSRIALFLADPLQSLGEVELIPSKSLVAQACQQGEPVYFEWTGGAENMPTAAQGENWAFAAPIFAGQEKLLLYSIGHRQAGTLERGGLSLLAQMLKSHLEARRAGDLGQAQAALDQLRSNLDPKVREAAERALRGEGEKAVLKILSLGEFQVFAQGERLDKQWGASNSPGCSPILLPLQNRFPKTPCWRISGPKNLEAPAETSRWPPLACANISRTILRETRFRGTASVTPLTNSCITGTTIGRSRIS